jgi:hypothetical protein
MFNLEPSITEWRQQMLAAGIKSPVPLEELESHLRDDIDQQMRKGVSAKAAFDAAVQRLGRAEALKREFRRGCFDLRRLSPAYLRVYCGVCAPLVLSLIWTSDLAETGFKERCVGTVAVSLIGFYVVGLPFFYRRLFSRQYRLMSGVLRVGYWFALIWTALALVSLLELFHFGKVVSLIFWSAYAAYFATFLAGARYEREMVTRVKLAAS